MLGRQQTLEFISILNTQLGRPSFFDRNYFTWRRKRSFVESIRSSTISWEDKRQAINREIQLEFDNGSQSVSRQCCRQCQNHYHGYVADSELQHSQSLIRSCWRGAINSFSVSAGRNQFMSCRRRAPRQYNVCTGVGTDFHSSRERLHTRPCEEYQRSPRPVLE
jgi:hypothetical protein